MGLINGVFTLSATQFQHNRIIVPKDRLSPLSFKFMVHTLNRLFQWWLKDPIEGGELLPFCQFSFAHSINKITELRTDEQF